MVTECGALVLDICTNLSEFLGLKEKIPTTMCLLYVVVGQNRIHTAVAMASHQPATLVISHPHTQRHSIRLLRPNQRLGPESIRQAPLRHRRLSHHFRQCRLAMSTSSQDQSR